MSASELILRQIASDFEDLARLAQRAIEALVDKDPHAAALHRVRDAAFKGAMIAREAIDDTNSQ